ncbi:hypothetical protein KRX51_03685 [Corynebacterium sp. TAE3-ERU12]|uniref:hypothetical protein n=1 Tax=Corynebacterium sp. TAE3-ERU12 TaxID=2849491 RepID=UPI001C4627DD|nr:hypothetical protein [Corynebacterium sp. TAE3-ERU12]MBV7295018.1 hypothetical protein [Corynebacterium sp. TAE3-ERU12]
MRSLSDGTITDTVAAFRGCASDQAVPENTSPAALRGLSWDLCRAHFADSKLKNKPKKRERDRLHLATYLANQGLVQAASPLLNKVNATHYDACLDVLKKHADDIADLDLGDYKKKKRRQKLLDAHQEISLTLLPNSGGTATAASRTLDGVFACIPCFDGAFSATMRYLSEDIFPASTFVAPNHEALEFVYEFYKAHDDEIDELASTIRVVDVVAGEFTDLPISRARVLEMFTTQFAETLPKR